METLEPMSIFNGKEHLTPPQALLYWIQERHQILLKKQAGSPKPWSANEVFQRTYFCNVRRETDRVTQWIRTFYSPQVNDPWFEYNIILSRFLNWPDTLGAIGYLNHHAPFDLESSLARLAKRGKVWGNAYVITTHGIPMAKASYLAHNVMGGVFKATQSPQGALLQALRPRPRGSLAAAHTALQSLEGLGSFLAAQVVADLKNTVDHPLSDASDWRSFVAPGPGSIRGLSWFWSGVTITPGNFQTYFGSMKAYVEENWDPKRMGDMLCSQDLQNCLCEYDKFCRVTNGTGRSKRNYPGV